MEFSLVNLLVVFTHTVVSEWCAPSSVSFFDTEYLHILDTHSVSKKLTNEGAHHSKMTVWVKTTSKFTSEKFYFVWGVVSC